MPAEKISVAAVVLLTVAAVLMINPLYLQEDARGDQFVQVERVSPAEGTAMRSADAERLDQLSVVPRYAARQSLQNGSFRLDRSGPPLALQLLGSEWAYIGAHSADQVYRPNVSVGDNETTVTFTPVAVETVEAELGVTPPERVREEEDSSLEVIWLSDVTEAVVFVGEFDEPWEGRLGDAIRAGELTTPNLNNASTLAPLGGSLRFVVDYGVPYRLTRHETNRSVVLETDRVSDETVLAETDIDTVETRDLPPETRAIIVDAIEAEDGSARYHRDEADVDAIEQLTSALIRHDGQYYVLYRSHVDDFSFLPLIQVLLTGLGGLIGFVGIYLAYRARGLG